MSSNQTISQQSVSLDFSREGKSIEYVADEFPVHYRLVYGDRKRNRVVGMEVRLAIGDLLEGENILTQGYCIFLRNGAAKPWPGHWYSPFRNGQEKVMLSKVMKDG